VKEQAINPIMSDKRGISPDMAQSLSKAFGLSVNCFLNLQKAYELSLAKTADPAVERRAFLQSTYPIREMIKRNWFKETSEISMLEAQMVRFFTTTSLDQARCFSHNAKMVGDYSETTPLQCAWLYRVQKIAAQMIVHSYFENS
jgi:HTH-type transcriptional regulator/antitoxin HigA